MKTSRCVIALWAAVFLTGNLLAQSAGLVQRVANTSLRMPPAPPVFGYATTNAFGTLTFTNPLAIVSPPGETNRLFVVEQRGRIAGPTNTAYSVDYRVHSYLTVNCAQCHQPRGTALGNSGNRPSYPLTDFTATISDTISDTAFEYYRVRVFEP